MTANRISSSDAESICGARMYFFSDYGSKKVNVRAGQYYKVIADSPDRGIVISNEPIENFIQAKYNCRIGKVSGMEDSATCIFPNS